MYEVQKFIQEEGKVKCVCGGGGGVGSDGYFLPPSPEVNFRKMDEIRATE